MNFLTLAAKNLQRRKGRTFLTVLGVAISITVLFSLLSLNSGYEKELNKEVNSELTTSALPHLCSCNNSSGKMLRPARM